MTIKKEIISVDDAIQGFCKVTYKGGIFEYIREDKISKENKKPGTPIKPADPVDNDGDSNDDLSVLNKKDLEEIARRHGFQGEVTSQVTKAILIEFINENK